MTTSRQQPPAAAHVSGRLSAAVFDMDGLLVDSEPLWHRAEIAVFGRYGVELSAELCRTTKGMFVGEVARHWYGRRPWEGTTPDEVAAEILDAMAVLLVEEAPLLPGVHHALRFCRARVAQLALASSSPHRLIDIVLDRHGLKGWFDVVHSAEAEPAGKPDPAVFLTTASLLGVDPRRCVVFEDSPAGVAAARAAGMRCVAVPEHHAAPDPGAFTAADAVLDSLGELAEGVWLAVESRVAPPSG
jgi:mannitol-1-/sugar-/sorbitol-6-/2-deoxyglucose-6-phosphatase